MKHGKLHSLAQITKLIKFRWNLGKKGGSGVLVNLYTVPSLFDCFEDQNK